MVQDFNVNSILLRKTDTRHCVISVTDFEYSGETVMTVTDFERSCETVITVTDFERLSEPMITVTVLYTDEPVMEILS